MEFIFFVLIPVLGGFLTLALGFFVGLVALIAGPIALVGLGYVAFRILQWLVWLLAQ